MSRRFEIVDVFVAPDAPGPGSGNQLAVVLDAEGLDAPAMQAIAAEFGFAETSFCFAPADPAHTAHVRIFTPAHEMPFAGHPNVGTAAVLARIGTFAGRPMGRELAFEESAGLVLARADPVASRALIRAPQPLSLGPAVAPEAVAQLCGLAADDILDQPFAPSIASVGAPFLFAPVSPDALARARPDAAAFAEAQASGRLAATGLHLHAERNEPGTVEARMFAPAAGVPEDAATGSAAAGLAALCHHHDPRRTRLVVRQGRFIGRPSCIEAEVRADGIWIGGLVRRFASGTLE
ncbi:MAG: PhzF family phenazine biosynthesis protein [Sphingomonadaceae bacterium]